MSDSAAIRDHFLTCLDNSRAESMPYPHLLLGGVYPDDVGIELQAHLYSRPEYLARVSQTTHQRRA